MEEFTFKFDTESYLCLFALSHHHLPSLLTTADTDYQWKIHSLVNVLQLAFYAVRQIQSIT